MPNLLQNVINGSLAPAATAEEDLLHLESDDNQTASECKPLNCAKRSLKIIFFTANVNAKHNSDYNKRISQPDNPNLSLNLNKSANVTKPKSTSHKIVHQFSGDITAIGSPPIPSKSMKPTSNNASMRGAGVYVISNRSGSTSPHNSSSSYSVVDGAGASGPAITPPAQVMNASKNNKVSDFRNSHIYEETSVMCF
jgi:hypothetical protein